MPNGDVIRAMSCEVLPVAKKPLKVLIRFQTPQGEVQLNINRIIASNLVHELRDVLERVAPE